MEEKRRARRMDIEVEITVSEISNKGAAEKKSHLIDVINVSTGGIAFLCQDKLEVDSYYNAHMVIWTKEKIDTVIHLIRADHGVYGGEFVGLPDSDKMKIKIYELFNFPGEERQ